MNIHDATEQAYKNGYEAGKRDAFKHVPCATMTDSEKIALAAAMIADFWETSNVSEDSLVALLNAITVVIHFGGKE